MTNISLDKVCNKDATMKILYRFLHKFYDFKISASELHVAFFRSPKNIKLAYLWIRLSLTKKNYHSHQLYDHNHCYQHYYCHHHHHHWKHFFRRCNFTHLIGIHLLHYSKTRSRVELANFLVTLSTCNFLMYIYHQTTIDKSHLYLPSSIINLLQNSKKSMLWKKALWLWVSL